MSHTLCLLLGFMVSKKQSLRKKTLNLICPQMNTEARHWSLQQISLLWPETSILNCRRKLDYVLQCMICLSFQILNTMIEVMFALHDFSALLGLDFLSLLWYAAVPAMNSPIVTSLFCFLGLLFLPLLGACFCGISWMCFRECIPVQISGIWQSSI